MAGAPAIHVPPINIEPLGYEELDGNWEQSIVTITHTECTVVVVETWSKG